MAKTKTTPEGMRRCKGSERFGIKPHDAPVADFPVQPSRKDGLGTMCAPHWKAYVKGLHADRKAATGGTASAEAPAKATTKAERRRTPMANKPAPAESPRVRKARETLAATEALPGPEYVKAVGSPEVQDALEVVNGHGPAGTDALDGIEGTEAEVRDLAPFETFDEEVPDGADTLDAAVERERAMLGTEADAA